VIRAATVISGSMMTQPVSGAAWPEAMLAGLDGVLFDIDGTITTDGRMTAAACW
jgi:hypothetical protein